MRAVHVGIRHDDDLVVAQLVDVEFIPPDAGAQRGDQRADLLARQHPVEARALDVQDLALQRQHRLVVAGATLLGGASGAVALDEEKLGLGRVLLLAIGELAGERGHVHRRLAPRQFTGFPRGLTRQRGLDDLADNHPRLDGVFLEPFAEFLVHQPLDGGPHLGGHKLVLGLRAELWVGHLHGQDTGQPLARVVPGEAHLLALGDAGRVRIVVHRPRQRTAKTRHMRAAIALRDVVGEGQHHFVVAVVPPHGDLDADAVLLALDIDRFLDHRGLGAVDILDEFPDAALVFHLDPLRLRMAEVLQHDLHAGIEEGEFPQAILEDLEGVVEVREGRGGGEETDLGAGLAPGVAHDLEVLDGIAAFEAGVMFLAVAPDAQIQPVGKRVDHGNADAVQAARDLVGVLVELPARMQLGHDDLGRRDAFFLVDADGNAAAIVADRDAVIGVQRDRHGVRMARQRLVDAVVHDLVDHVVQARAVIGVADIHAGPLAHGLQALENLDGIRAVFRGRRSVVCHA